MKERREYLLQGRWRAGEVLSSDLSSLQESGVEVSAVEMESVSPFGPGQRVKVVHKMSPMEGDAAPVGEFWDRDCRATRREFAAAGAPSLAAVNADAPPVSADRAQLRYHLYLPTASDKARTKGTPLFSFSPIPILTPQKLPELSYFSLLRQARRFTIFLRPPKKLGSLYWIVSGHVFLSSALGRARRC